MLPAARFASVARACGGEFPREGLAMTQPGTIDHAQAQAVVGEIALSDGDAAGAAQAFDSALAITRDAPAWWRSRARARAALGRFEDAAADLETAHERSLARTARRRRLARLAEHAGDDLGAYGTLATGWATVSDLLGPELARAAFEPVLREMRLRWGGERFDAARGAHEAARRAKSRSAKKKPRTTSVVRG
jgi:tetratricopeptide (TPR) repeat protein